FPSNTHAFSDANDLNRWMSAYYQDPAPQRLREAVEEFIAEPTRLAHPERLDAPAHFFAVVFQSNPEVRPEITALLGELKNATAERFVERIVMNSGKLEFTRAHDPNDLDILWAHFAATGSTDAVRMVLEALDFAQR
ncbi:hypothetical protein RZS08_19510, partial [Arthrospira platensis SPKY1]|nr:hypothetical protein [Arthrospira platensis SPKY1]